MTTQISRARDASDLTDARRFWYDVYVKEMGRDLNDASTDHESRELSDPFDEIGRLFIARDDNRVVGTVLGTPGRDASFGYYETLYRLNELTEASRLRSSLTNKLIVAKEKRRSPLALKLATTVYRQGLSDGVQRNYIDCNAHLVSFFRRMGYRRHRGWVIHKDYGLVYSLVLHLEDIEHLRASESPFVSHYQSIRETPNQINGANHSDSTSSHSAAI
ncbi:MAG: GNAT family N-acetyltransferase [Pseudomonadota bacterium]